jgi:mRNA-degrading endonuclease RelE of RelBE toxin-antitoxin system
MQKHITVVEVDPFAATAKSAGLAEDERQQITVFLANNPEEGDVEPDTGGLRKLRWPGRSKGKRGGYRVIYYFFDDSAPVYLLAIYPKNQQIMLAPAQKKRLRAQAKILKAEAKVSRLEQLRRAAK